MAELKDVQLEQGVIRYHDQGEGPTLLFVHGIFVNSVLWHRVASMLSDRFRCIVPDLPLGGHSVPMNPDADLTPPGVARIVADLMEALDLRDVTLIGNDTGGAICQIVVTEHPERIGRLVLTNCDAYEAFFPVLLRPFHHAARLFGTRFSAVLARVLRSRRAQRLLVWPVARRPTDDATLDAYLSSFIRDSDIRRDVTRFLAAVSNRHTLEAARRFPGFDRPVLIVWGQDDFVFPSRLAHRLQRNFPDAQLEFVPDSRAFVPHDRPEALASRIAAFSSAPQQGRCDDAAAD